MSKSATSRPIWVVCLLIVTVVVVFYARAVVNSGFVVWRVREKPYLPVGWIWFLALSIKYSKTLENLPNSVAAKTRIAEILGPQEGGNGR